VQSPDFMAHLLYIHTYSNRMRWYGLVSSVTGPSTVPVPCKLGSDPTGFVEDRKILDRQRDSQILKKDSGPYNDLIRLLVR
jgi:hypothetical protein